jgi:ribonuclease BN (tRNA processing enzyme)
MKIQILGAHNIESKESRFISLLIDDVLAVDAGALTSSLSREAQRNLKAVILTHQHYDHIRDIPALGINFYLYESTIHVYAAHATYKVIQAHLLNDIVYPNYIIKPQEKPSIRFRTLEAGKAARIAGYTVLPVKVNHAVPTVGYQITSANGKKMFYTADTGPGLVEVWRQVSPDLLIIEVTALNEWHDFALKTGHLTPALLQQEMESFREIKGYLPQIVLVHMNPIDEAEIKKEMSAVTEALKTTVSFGYEGMILRL